MPQRGGRREKIAFRLEIVADQLEHSLSQSMKANSTQLAGSALKAARLLVCAFALALA